MDYVGSLVLEQGSLKSGGNSVPLANLDRPGGALLGRDTAKCDVVVDDAGDTVGREQARLYRKDNRLVVENLKDKPIKAIVGGQETLLKRNERAEVGNGDKLQVGAVVVLLDLPFA